MFQIAHTILIKPHKNPKAGMVRTSNERQGGKAEHNPTKKGRRKKKQKKT